MKQHLSLKLLTVMLLMFILMMFSTALAHRPIFTSGDNNNRAHAIRIIDPEVSWAVYGDLKKKNQVDYYKFEGEAGMRLFLQMTIPQRPGLHNFKPMVALIGPGLEQRNPSYHLQIMTGEGIKLYAADGRQGEYYEPYTQTSYITYRSYRIKLPSTGTYYLAVFNPAGKMGRYTLAVGTKEIWGATDLFKFPLIWLKVRWWYSPWQTVALLAIIIIGLIIIGIIIGKLHSSIIKFWRKIKEKHAEDDPQDPDDE